MKKIIAHRKTINVKLDTLLYSISVKKICRSVL